MIFNSDFERKAEQVAAKEKRVTVSFLVEPRTREYIKGAKVAWGVSEGRVIDKLVRDRIRRRKPIG